MTANINLSIFIDGASLEVNILGMDKESDDFIKSLYSSKGSERPLLGTLEESIMLFNQDSKKYELDASKEMGEPIFKEMMKGLIYYYFKAIELTNHINSHDLKVSITINGKVNTFIEERLKELGYLKENILDVPINFINNVLIQLSTANYATTEDKEKHLVEASFFFGTQTLLLEKEGKAEGIND